MFKHASFIIYAIAACFLSYGAYFLFHQPNSTLVDQPVNLQLGDIYRYELKPEISAGYEVTFEYPVYFDASSRGFSWPDPELWVELEVTRADGSKLWSSVGVPHGYLPSSSLYLSSRLIYLERNK